MNVLVDQSKINSALVELQTQLPRISKDLTAKVKSERTGAQYTYSYADLALISREVLPVLAKCGLAFTSRPTMREGKFVLVYELRHVSGEMIEGEYPLPGGSPQEVGGAITYARRQCLCAVTGVTPDDDDNDAIAAEKAAKRQRRDPQLKAQAVSMPPPMNASQQKRLQKAFEGLGMDAKEARLAYAQKVVGRPLKSATELTRDEADSVITNAETEAAKAGDGEAWLASQQPPEGVGVPS